MRALGNAKILMIPLTMTIFSILGFSIGLAEETIIFVPLGILIARTLGYDAMTGAAMVILGAASGFIGGMLNPFYGRCGTKSLNYQCSLVGAYVRLFTFYLNCSHYNSDVICT